MRIYLNWKKIFFQNVYVKKKEKFTTKYFDENVKNDEGKTPRDILSNQSDKQKFDEILKEQGLDIKPAINH